MLRAARFTLQGIGRNVRQFLLVRDTALAPRRPDSGRVFSRPDSAWFWTITAHGREPSIYDRGYSATREQAMADFKAQR
ncbi:MAG: hypothetical protein WA214_23865 [Pseudolabrys sp.]